MWKALSYKTTLISLCLNILYPSQCPLCQRKSDTFTYSPICAGCWSAIKRYTGPSCRICAKPFTSELSDICAHCFKKSPPFSHVINFGMYEGVLAEAINQFKFYGFRRLSKPLGMLMLNLNLPVVDAIVPVPLHKESLRERGFNQSLLIARTISKNLQIPLLIDTLVKKKETPPQIGLSAKERFSNLRNTFEVTGNMKDYRILLVDDVMTTGATVAECSKELLKAGAQEVVVLTLARSHMM